MQLQPLCISVRSPDTAARLLKVGGQVVSMDMFERNGKRLNLRLKTADWSSASMRLEQVGRSSHAA